jgi:hypothetical protein
MVTLSPETIRKDQSILNRATQGSYLEDDVKDIWFFYKNVPTITSVNGLDSVLNESVGSDPPLSGRVRA